MAFNPQRSWAVTYNQMWNLSMKEPLTKNYSNSRHASGFAHMSNGVTAQSQNQKNHNTKRKSDYCLNFNKGVPCKFGNKCKFVERCKYCDAASHGVYCCPKLQKRGGDGSKNAPVQETAQNKQ